MTEVCEACRSLISQCWDLPTRSSFDMWSQTGLQGGRYFTLYGSWCVFKAVLRGVARPHPQVRWTLSTAYLKHVTAGRHLNFYFSLYSLHRLSTLQLSIKCTLYKHSPASTKVNSSRAPSGFRGCGTVLGRLYLTPSGRGPVGVSRACPCT